MFVQECKNDHIIPLLQYFVSIKGKAVHENETKLATLGKNFCKKFLQNFARIYL